MLPISNPVNHGFDCTKFIAFAPSTNTTSTRVILEDLGAKCEDPLEKKGKSCFAARGDSITLPYCRDAKVIIRDQTGDGS